MGTHDSVYTTLPAVLINIVLKTKALSHGGLKDYYMYTRLSEQEV